LNYSRQIDDNETELVDTLKAMVNC